MSWTANITLILRQTRIWKRWTSDFPAVQRQTMRRRNQAYWWLDGAMRLESRCLLSAVRMVSWNTLNQPNNTTQEDAYSTVFSAIEQHSLLGNSQRLDLLALQETDIDSAERIEDILNALYPSANFQTVISSMDGGGDFTAFLYSTETISLIESVEVGSGVMTHPSVRAQFRPVGTTGEADFYGYTIHLKAGNSTSDQNQRAVEADFLRNNADSLGQGVNVIFAGDFNLTEGSSEVAWSEMYSSGFAQARDAANTPGDWNSNSAFKSLHTHSTTTVRSRLDFQFVSTALLDGVGLDYLEGSFDVFGNNGTHNMSSSITTGTGQPANVLSALVTASDHLPVIAEYDIVSNVSGLQIVESGGSTNVVEGGTVDTYIVSLRSQPTSNVTVTVTPNGQLDLGAGPGQPVNLLFTPDNAFIPQTVIVAATNDSSGEGHHQATISHSVSSADPEYDQLPVSNVSVSIVDDDAPVIVINELDADTPSTDTAEFIELYDGGVGNVSLTGLTLVFYNGANDSSYLAIDLDGRTTDENGFFLLGNAAVPGVDLVFSGNTLQNGADAVALYVGDASSFPNGTGIVTSNLLDALVYDTSDADDAGLLALMPPGKPQVNENENGQGPNESLARIPDGGDPFQSNLFVAMTPSPGTWNVSPTPGITVAVNTQGVSLIEGESQSYTIALDTVPTSNVTITINPNSQLDLGAGPGAPVNLTFTPQNARLPQTITITAVEDGVAEESQQGMITHSVSSSDSSYNGFSVANIPVAVSDVPPPQIAINEVDVETLSGDSRQFIELFDGGNGNTSLDGLSIVLYDGATDTRYATISLDGHMTDSRGYFVLGNSSVANVDLIFANGLLENGPAAIGLYTGDTSGITNVTTAGLIDAVVYGVNSTNDPGLAPLLLEGSLVNENANGDMNTESLARRPDGGTLRSTLSYKMQAPTPGQPNSTAALPGISVLRDRLVEGGPGRVLDIVLDSIPNADVIMRLTPDSNLDLGAGPGQPVELVFTPQNADQIQTITVLAVDDGIVEGVHLGRIGYDLFSEDSSYNGFAVEPTIVSIEDGGSAPLQTATASQSGSSTGSGQGSGGDVSLVTTGNGGEGGEQSRSGGGSGDTSAAGIMMSDFGTLDPGSRAANGLPQLTVSPGEAGSLDAPNVAGSTPPSSAPNVLNQQISRNFAWHSATAGIDPAGGGIGSLASRMISTPDYAESRTTAPHMDTFDPTSVDYRDPPPKQSPMSAQLALGIASILTAATLPRTLIFNED